VSTPLRTSDLRFINRVAARRFAGGEPGAVDEAVLAAALAAAEEGPPFARAAALAATLLQRRAFASAPLPTALLAVHCALALEGFSLIAPQGVTAGMIRGLADGGSAATLARWLEDRAVPAASG
jgi:prophage maintenance system killer protein